MWDRKNVLKAQGCQVQLKMSADSFLTQITPLLNFLMFRKVNPFEIGVHQINCPLK